MAVAVARRKVFLSAGRVELSSQNVTQIMADPAVKTRLAELGNEIQAMTPGELAAFLGKEDQTVAEVEKTGVLKPE